MQILSIDDSKTIRRTIQNLTEVIGVGFLEAENGKKGIEILEAVNGNVGLILLDMEMPVMNGREFLKIIKKDRRYRSIPIIMLTSVTEKEKVIDAIRAGARQYITKPFSGENLLAKIIQTIGIETLEEL